MLAAKNPSVAEAPKTDYQQKQNEQAISLPFESFIGSEELKQYFDTDEGAKVTAMANTLQPIGIGVQKASLNNSPTAVGRGMGNESGMGMPQAGGTYKQLPQLIDPFTQEVISTEYLEDDKGEIVLENGKTITVEHDYWFRVKMKIALKPKTTETRNRIKSKQRLTSPPIKQERTLIYGIHKKIFNLRNLYNCHSCINRHLSLEHNDIR